MNKKITSLIILLSFCLGSINKSFAQSPSPQPSTGPGGSSYPNAAVKFTKFGIDISNCYWLYEPAAPKPDSAYTVVFWHGTNAQNNIDSVPAGLKLFCEHLCKKGYTVIFPLYQYGALSLPFQQQLVNGANVVNLALSELNTGPNHVRPKRDGKGNLQLAAVGISRGGGMTLNVASMHDTLGLPAFKALCAIVPGAGQSLSNIEANSKVLVINGSDNALNYNQSQQAFDSLHQIPCANKHLIVVNSDLYGNPYLIAEHDFAGSGSIKNNPSKLNNLDYYGVWKYATALMDCAFINKNCEYCLGADKNLIGYMGTWSDGKAVTPATIADSCASIINSLDNTKEAEANNIYPNPVCEILHIRLYQQQTSTAKIYNAQGQCLAIFAGDTYDVANLAPGIYYIEIQGKKTNYSSKFIKQ